MSRITRTLVVLLMLAGCTPREVSTNVAKKTTNTPSQEATQRAASSLSLTSGPSREFSESEIIEMQIKVDGDSMRVRFGIGAGDAATEALTWIDSPTLAELRSGESKYADYQNTLTQLVNALAAAQKRQPKANAISIVTWKNDEPEWGFVTLALDAATSFNSQLEENSRGEKSALEIITLSKP